MGPALTARWAAGAPCSGGGGGGRGTWQARRRWRRRLRGALGGEARPLGSHPRRGERRAGASRGSACVTCPQHAHVTRAPRPSRRALARRRRFLGSRRLLLARLRGVGQPLAAWGRPLSTRSRRLGPPLPFPFPRGCRSQPIRSPDARRSAATQLSAVNQQPASGGSSAVSQPVSPQAKRSIP